MKLSDLRPRHWTSRKFVALAITDILLIAGALLVQNGNFSALATALVAAMGAFVGSNIAADHIAGKGGPEVRGRVGEHEASD